MTFLAKPLMIVAALSLAACTDAGRFGKNDPAAGSGAGTGSGVIEGSASDPKSPLYFQQSIGDRVLFEIDQHTLNATAKQVLDGQASWLTTNNDYSAVIEGHADEQNTREYNLALGARRANAVREYLMSRGLPASRMKTVSYGKERPFAMGHNEAAWAQNRRAQFVARPSGK